jgi:hypothetical protein
VSKALSIMFPIVILYPVVSEKCAGRRSALIARFSKVFVDRVLGSLDGVCRPVLILTVKSEDLSLS